MYRLADFRQERAGEFTASESWLSLESFSSKTEYIYLLYNKYRLADLQQPGDGDFPALNPLLSDVIFLPTIYL
jgi:hypothetical protein